MAHPLTAEAVDAPVDDMDSAAAAIGRLNLGGDDDPRDDDQHDAGDDDLSDDQAGDDLDLSDDGDEGDDEPDNPAIEAPASLNADEKAKFAQLPSEAQRLIAEVESRRNGQVQQATTKASEAQRAAETRAAQADAQAKAVYAQQLKAFTAQFAPQRPDPQLAHTDPATFIALNAQYEAQSAQFKDLEQQINGLSQEAETQMSQAEMADRDRELMTVPEVMNEETRNAFFERSIAVAKEMGLNPSDLSRANATEWKALRQVSDWKEKADKYDAAMTRQMQRVREGKKTKSARPNAAQPSSGREQGFRDAKQRARQTGDVRDAAAAIARLG